MSLGCNTCDRKDSDTHGVKIKEEPDEEVEDLHVKLNHHECQQCSAIFFAKPLLVKHMKTVHSQSQNSCGCEHFSHPQQCPLCTSFFLQRSLLMKHIQESHGTHTCKKCKKVFIYKHNFRK